MKYSAQEQEDYYGYIYIILDQKHNKVYVGQKKGRIENSKNYFGSGTIISNIIKDRGEYFLKKTVLGVCYSKEELKYWETECKHFFNAFDRNYGYNIAIIDDGGDILTYHPNRDIIILNISLTLRLKTSNLTMDEKNLLLFYLEDYKKGNDPKLDNYKNWLINKKEQNEINRIESLLTSEQLSELHKIIWRDKSPEEKQSFIDKMVEVNNSEQHISRSKESRQRPEYKELMSNKMIEHYTKPGSMEVLINAITKQWEAPGRKEEYSTKMTDWHSKEENKKKHSDATRTPISFIVEDYINSLNEDFTIYDIMEKCECTYNIVSYHLEKEFAKGNIVKTKRRGNIPIKYRRILDEVC